MRHCVVASYRFFKQARDGIGVSQFVAYTEAGHAFIGDPTTFSVDDPGLPYKPSKEEYFAGLTWRVVPKLLEGGLGVIDFSAPNIRK